MENKNSILFGVFLLSFALMIVPMSALALNFTQEATLNPTESINSEIAFSPLGDYVMHVSDAGFLNIYNTANFSLYGSASYDVQPTALPNSDYLAVNDQDIVVRADGGFFVYDYQGNFVADNSLIYASQITHPTFNPSGSDLALQADSGTIYILDATQNYAQKDSFNYGDTPNGIEYSSDGSYLALVDPLSNLDVYETTDYNSTFSVTSAVATEELSFSQSNPDLVAIGNEDAFEVWNHQTTNIEFNQFGLGLPSNIEVNYDHSDDGRYFTISGGGTTIFYNATDYTEIARYDLATNLDAYQTALSGDYANTELLAVNDGITNGLKIYSQDALQPSGVSQDVIMPNFYLVYDQTENRSLNAYFTNYERAVIRTNAGGLWFSLAETTKTGNVSSFSNTNFEATLEPLGNDIELKLQAVLTEFSQKYNVVVGDDALTNTINQDFNITISQSLSDYNINTQGQEFKTLNNFYSHLETGDVVEVNSFDDLGSLTGSMSIVVGSDTSQLIQTTDYNVQIETSTGNLTELSFFSNNQNVLDGSLEVIVNKNDGGTQTDSVLFSITEPATVPSVDNTQIISFTNDSMFVQTEILSDGGGFLEEDGFLYDTNPNVDISDARFETNLMMLGLIDANITGLQEGTTYYVRGYACNEVGCSLSNNEVNITTLTSQPPVTPVPSSSGSSGSGTSYAVDADGNVVGVYQNGNLVQSSESESEKKGTFLSLTGGESFDINSWATDLWNTIKGWFVQ